ncbi:hypothetical protein B0H21DRAFT_797396, partial [Amylocystis lapponica]
MSRRSSNLEFSIRGDELEQHRIQLEHNLQHTDLSLHLSSIPGDDCSDVEYPRHHSAPSPFSAFASFEQRSGDQFELDEQSQYHAWSRRSLNDDDAIRTFAGETLSTAAHHASALTLSAGLGGRGTRRDVSLSGAEYDPDRPLQGIMAGINSRFSGLDMDSTNPRHLTSKTVDFDPLVVDDTAELDRVLQSGHAAGFTLRSPVSSGQSSSSGSEPASPNLTSSRPKLSDALNRAAFSPKRPRSALSHRSPSSHPLPSLYNGNAPQLHPRSSSPFVREQYDVSTPKSRQTGRLNQSLSYVQQQSLPPATVDPEVHVHPATPSIANSSKFTKMARGLARELEMEQSRWGDQRADVVSSRPLPAQSTVHGVRGMKHIKERNPFRNIGNQVPTPFDPVPTPGKDSRTPHKGRVHLPDVTGLTSAVESPAKAGLEYYGYDVRFDRETEARLLTTLNNVQSKLAFLESENSISRRRVRELELELESCKHEVARERTKVLEREGSSSRAPGREETFFANGLKNDRGKMKGRKVVEGEVRPQAADDSRYKEAVEEKKGKPLEALISTLRAHLSRLTAELSDHHRLLEDLRSLRDSDARTLSDKGKDVDKLRQEVERLAGEVEVLRGVVEEGLKERRVAREQLSREISHLADREGANEPTVEQVDQSLPAGRPAETSATGMFIQREDTDSDTSDEDHNSTTSSSPRSPTPSPRRRTGLADKTVRTDYATLGSSLAAGAMSTKPFIDDEELQRISAEVEERRSERSALAKSRSLSVSSSRLSSRSGSPSPVIQAARVVSTPSIGVRRRDTPDVTVRQDVPLPTTDPNACEEANGPPLSRPSAPTPAHALGKGHPSDGGRATAKRTRSQTNEAPLETPFPQIRGAQLERLFFSAPEHNAQTCTVCHRRRRHKRDFLGSDQQTPFWLSAGRRNVKVQDDDDDEGFASGQEDQVPYQGKGKAREYDRWKDGGHSKDKAPPQTVLARVLRELEDDFTHFKSIYVELADQYKVMDAVSNVVKRNVLAEHLREVIDLLEQKVIIF